MSENVHLRVGIFGTKLTTQQNYVKYPSKDTCKNYIFVGEKLDIAC